MLQTQNCERILVSETKAPEVNFMTARGMTTSPVQLLERLRLSIPMRPSHTPRTCRKQTSVIGRYGDARTP